MHALRLTLALKIKQHLPQVYALVASDYGYGRSPLNRAAIHFSYEPAY